MRLRSLLAALRPAPAVRRRPTNCPRSGNRPQIETLEDRCLLSADVVLHWNELLVQSLASQPAQVPMARNMALVHVALFDAVNAIDRSYEPYYTHVHASPAASLEAAAAQAAHDTLTALYPSRQSSYDVALAADLAGIPTGRARQGVVVGREVARQILELRADDGSAANMPYTPPNLDPGQWQPTPPDFPAAANQHVAYITPFAIKSNTQFRPGPPPALDSAEYAEDFNEVKELGGAVSATRTSDQTQVAFLWRLARTNHQVWNRIAQDVVAAHHLSLADSARLFAMIDMGINDGLQTSFSAKYHYTLWRPITAIQRADEDGNNATDADPNWMTLHPNTPPYPAYTSNASSIGAVSATVLAGVFGRDDVPFDIHWDAYGFPGVTRHYNGFWEAAQEMANSRIYGGIHFRFDCEAGQQIGRDVGGYILGNLLQPRDSGDDEQLSVAAVAPRKANQSLRAEQVQPLWTQAIAGWRAAGIDSPAPGRIDVGVAGRGGSALGEAGDSIITLNDQVAGGVTPNTLDAGIRRTLGQIEMTATDRPDGSATKLAWGADMRWIDYGLANGEAKMR
jgi:hypothetical protein